MGLLPHWKAAFLYTDPTTGQDVVINLPAPLRDIRTRLVQRRYVEEALDGTRSVKTIGPAHYELVGRIRFVDAPDAVLSMLRAAANGAQLVYTENVFDPTAKTYAAELIWDESAIELGMDADLGKIGRGEVTVVLRSSVPWGALYAGEDVLFRYRAGEPLSAAGITHTRASGATLIDRTGTLQEVGPDVPRIDWSHGRPALRLEPAGTNGIRNPRCEGAAIGVVGSDGALPTFWQLDTTSGLTVSVEAAGTDAGLPYIDLRIQGTPTGGTARLYFEGATQIAAAPDEVWTGSVYARLVGGSLVGVNDVLVRIAEYQSTGDFLRASQQAVDLARSRHSSTATMGADTGRVRHGLSVSVTQGVPVDLTLRIGGPQLEQAPVPSSLILPPSGSPAASSRALDVPTAPWAHGLISFTGYARFIETGGAEMSNATVASWFGAGSGEIWLRSGAQSPIYWITLRDSRGASAQVQVSPGVTTALGDLVELMPQIEVSAQGVRARLIQAVDGGVPVASSWTSYVQADWVPTTMRLVSRSGGGNQGQLDLHDLMALRGSDWTMDQIRQRFGIS